MSRVLAGVQVPPSEAGAFEAFLLDLGYPYTDETANVRRRSTLR